MSDDAESALDRWSRRKREAVDQEQRKPRPARLAGTPDAVPAPNNEGIPGDGATGEEVCGEGVCGDDVRGEDASRPDLALPDVASLDRDSDYTVFLKAGVPADIRRQALRTLWRSDPVLANLDGLNDYEDDYSRTRDLSPVVRTAYRVGKGYLRDLDPAAEAVAPDRHGVDDAREDAPVAVSACGDEEAIAAAEVESPEHPQDRQPVHDDRSGRAQTSGVADPNRPSLPDDAA